VLQQSAFLLRSRVAWLARPTGAVDLRVENGSADVVQRLKSSSQPVSRSLIRAVAPLCAPA